MKPKTCLSPFLTDVIDSRLSRYSWRVGFSSRSLSLVALLACSSLYIEAQDDYKNSEVSASASLAQQTAEIHNAASTGNVEKMSTLLERDPSLLESRDDTGMTPLMVAARDGRSNVVTFLIEKGADIKATTRGGDYDALALAAKNGQKDVVALLLDKGADANRKDSDGDTPVALAQNERQAEVLAL